MALQHSPSIVTSNLSLCMDSANPRSYPGSGTKVYDISGSNLSGTLVNSPSYVSGSSGYFQFDGIDDYITFGNTTVANVFTGDFTVSAWVYRLTNAGPAWGNIVGDYYTANTTGEWQIMISSTAQLFVYRIGTGYVINQIASGYSANQWINVVLTRIGSTITLYANSNVVTTATNSDTWGSPTGNLNIGVDGNNTAEPLNGRISDVMIYKGFGLSSTQVAQNFNALRGRYGV